MTVTQECKNRPLERLLSRRSADGSGRSCDSISGLTGGVGTVTGGAECLRVAEADLKEAARVPGGQPASLRDTGQEVSWKTQCLAKVGEGTRCFAPLAS